MLLENKNAVIYGAEGRLVSRWRALLLARGLKCF
jgi:hypothetical protein